MKTPSRLLSPLAVFWLLLSLVLTGCGDFPAQPVYANATPYSGEQPTPLNPIKNSLRPTATAQVFQLRATSTPFPTATPGSANMLGAVGAANAIFGYGPVGFPAEVDPLTGLTASDPNLLNRRPLAIKITNFPRHVRPQWGLSAADNVYEYYIGDQFTRFIAVYYGTDADRVGPVRSGRFFDEHIVRMYKSIFVFGFADERVINPWLESDLKNYLVVEQPNNCPPLCRIGPKTDYNTLYANTQQVSQYISERGTNNDRQNLDGLRFEQNAPTGGEPARHVSLYFTRLAYSLWDYDPASGRYVRSEDTQDDDGQGSNLAYAPHIDSATGKQISTDNMVVLFIPHEYFVNTETTEMVKMNFMGQGKAYAFREGQAYPIVWKRAAPETLVSLYYPDGRLYPLKPGKTWFEVMGETSAMEQQAGGNWGFKFEIP